MLKRFISFFTKVKSAEVSIFDKAKMAILGVESAMTVFSGLISELKTANENLQTVVTDCEKVITEHTEVQDKAKASINEYESLLNNVEKLIGGTK